MLKTVKAKKVREGDFIPGLDNGYVVEVEECGYENRTRRITFHDTQGDEAYLECADDMRITVKRD